MQYDILIRQGHVYDGSGTPAAVGDVAISGDRIAAVGRSLEGDAGITVDAGGLAVAPGFIDVKTHSDFTLPVNPKAESKVRQGVTTEIIGHCGFSAAPALAGRVEALRDYLSPSAPWLTFRETSFTEYLSTFPQTAVNAGMLVGHNTLRLMVMGLDARAPTPSELKRIIELLEEALDAGALGLSTGLFTPPGAYAQPAEIIALCNVVKRFNAGYFTHVRDESNKIIEAVEEAIAVAETCRVHVQIVHLKCSGMDNWGKTRQVLEMISGARERGLEIDCDAYPYTAGSNPLKSLLPPWVQEGGGDKMLQRLSQTTVRQRIRSEIEQNGLNNWGRIPSWDAIQISVSPNQPEYAGRTINDLATERGQAPIDTVCDYLIADKGATRVLVTSMAEDDVRELVCATDVLVGSDGNCIADYGVVGQGMPHPRFYGTFPRVIGHYVKELQLIPLERAIHKMTGSTARALKLQDRGLLQPGHRADVVIFDPDDFKDRATYAKPHQYPTGRQTTVIVNGTVVVDSAKHTEALPGQVLRRDAMGSVY